MDSAIKVAYECDGHQNLATTDTLSLVHNSWLNGSPLANTTNSKLLFISVGYIKDPNEYKLIPTVNYPEDTTCVDFVQHVSPLDPNMSSAACYSPTSPQCNNADISFNSGVVVQNLLSTSASVEQLIDNNRNTYVDHLAVPYTSAETLSSDSNLLKDVTDNKYLLNENGASSGILQLVSSTETQNGVELLITDQVTGISYNINAQEYMVDRSLADEQQLLDALTPAHFLDNELLDIDDTSLKSELSDVVETIDSPETLQTQTTNSNLVNKTASVAPSQLSIKTENYEDDSDSVFHQENLRRSQRRIELQNIENEDRLLSDVQTISDKPIETRARASLPASYLAIVKQTEDQFGVIARKMIPKRTQFGPVEGLLVVDDREVSDGLQLLVDCGTGSIHRLDVSDENYSNWMCFVRKANTYLEQNLLLTQLGSSLFYVTTVNIMPKQELLVGYSSKYAKQYNLPLLKPIPDRNKMWPCFECYESFQTSADLQTHLNVHDGIERNGVKLKKSSFKKKKIKKEYKKFLIECKLCTETFSFSMKDSEILKKHSMKHYDDDCSCVEDNFSVISYNCEKCGMSFESEVLLEIHNLQHKVNNNTVLNNLICPKCQSKFHTQLQLIEHVNNHCRDKYAPIVSSKGFKCPICYKIFASDERIQRHMFVHGSDDSKPLKCDTCNKRFLNNSALTCHLKTHSTDQKHFECPICKDSFDQVVQLKLHVSQHCVNGKYNCPHCKKIFSEYSIIRKHIRAFHCDRKHTCSYCTKPFPTLDKLRMHLLRHSDHKEFLCADCGKQFKRKDKLKEHTKRMHGEKSENTLPKPVKTHIQNKKFTPRVLPTEYHRFIYKCHACLVGFKRRGMLVNHLAKQHPDIKPDSVPELNLPILRTTRDYYCQYCDKVYKSSSKRKAHILKNHPGQALPMSNRRHGTYHPDLSAFPNPTFSQTVGSITTPPQSCQWCHKQYASKAKLLQHQRKKHSDLVHNQPEQAKNSLRPLAPNHDDIDPLDTITLKKEPKYLQVASEELLPESAVILNEERNDQFYQIISVPGSNNTLNFNNAGELSSGCVSSDSRLYLLLTTGNGLIQPPC